MNGITRPLRLAMGSVRFPLTIREMRKKYEKLNREGNKTMMKFRHSITSFVILLLLASSLNALKPEREYRAIPSDYGIIYREVVFQTIDSLKLKGWFFPAQDTSGIANSIIGRLIPVPLEMKCKARSYATLDGLRRPTIIICDGDAGNMTDLIFYAYHLFTRGYNVLLFDWRGFGGSSDWPTERDRLCYSQFIVDYDAAVNSVKQQPEVDTSRIGVMGFSTGAYLSFAIAAKRNDIRAYVGRALLTSFDEILPILKKSDPNRNFMAPENYPKELLPIRAAKKVKIPVFLIVGENDDRTPVWMSKAIMAKLKGPKELWVVPGAEHGGVKGPEFITYPEFFNKVADFFDRQLKGNSEGQK
jgi:alpha-beta hydrolase superfamily lysophospholipase